MVKYGKMTPGFEYLEELAASSSFSGGDGPIPWRTPHLRKKACVRRGYHIVHTDTDKKGDALEMLQCYVCHEEFSRIEGDYRVREG